MKSLVRIFGLASAAAFAAACASVGGGTGGTVNGGAGPTTEPATPSVKWPVRTREHVDLWLHGFAMISADTSPVPLFRRGYSETVMAARVKASATTDLDVNHDALAKRLRDNPTLVNAQFLPFSFDTWEALVTTIDAFVKADGDPK